MRVRLHRSNGSYVESSELAQAEAEELSARYFSALHGYQPLSSVATGTIVVSGETHGLPTVFYKDEFSHTSLV